MKNKFIKLVVGIRLVSILGSLLQLVAPQSDASTGTSNSSAAKRVRFKVFSLNKNNSVIRKDLYKGDANFTAQPTQPTSSGNGDDDDGRTAPSSGGDDDDSRC